VKPTDGVSAAALRVRLDAATKPNFAQLIDRAEKDGLIDHEAWEVLHAGRRLRSDQIDATTLGLFSPAIASRVIGSARQLAAGIFAN
jgi:hypothetical protein